MNVSDHSSANAQAADGIEWELLPFSFTIPSTSTSKVVALRCFQPDGVYLELALQKRTVRGHFVSTANMAAQAFSLFEVFFGGDERYLGIDRLLLAADLRRGIARARKSRAVLLEADFRRLDDRDIIAVVSGSIPRQK